MNKSLGASTASDEGITYPSDVGINMGEVKITGLFVYPVKSCRGIALDTAIFDEFGFRHDRRWMIVDDKGRFLTQRRFPKMALIEARPVDDTLILKAPDQAPLTVPALGSQITDKSLGTNEASTKGIINVRVWGFEGQARDVGSAAAAWLSEYLGVSCRLVAAGPELARPIDPDYDPFSGRVAFADGFPLLLISDASLTQLNSRLATPVGMDRFRPNITVGGCEPHAEDGWRELTGNGVRLHVVKPCARCTVPQVDQSSGLRGVDREPTATLKTYRQDDDGEVYFGQNLIHQAAVGTTLSVGDRLTLG